MSVRLRLFLFVVLIPIVGRATEIIENYRSVRALGMGNAYTTVVDNKDALFYQPAALGKIQGIHIHLLDLGIGTNAVDVYQKYQSLSGSNYATTIRGFFGQQVSLGLSDIASVSVPGFAFAIFDSLNLSLILNNPAYPNLDLSVLNDFGFATGLSFSIIPNILEIGVVGKRVTRYGTKFPFGPSILATLSNSELTDLANNYGTGYGADSGILLTLPVPAKPTFSFAWQDMGTTRYIREKGSRPIPVSDNNMVYGFGFDIDAYILNIRPAFDFRHATQYEEPIGKRIHFGIEFDFPLLAFRVGANQGYYTAGFGVDLKYFTLDVASYGVELGEYPGQKEDRRYVLNLSVDLNMDPKISLGKGGPSKRFYRR